jgi:AraC family transcriptional regulator
MPSYYMCAPYRRLGKVAVERMDGCEGVDPDRAQASAMLAAGSDWSVRDVVCTAGPRDRPFTEIDRFVSIAVVCSGTFTFRSKVGRALLSPGSLLLGNADSEYECSHEHARGDRCISFHFEPPCWERITQMLGVEWRGFRTHRIPPVPALLALTTEVAISARRPSVIQMEELALRVAECALRLSAGVTSDARLLKVVDEERAALAVRHIERHFAEPLSLEHLSAIAGLSRFHFLRVFRNIVGVTPHQYLMRLRLSEAATRLRTSNARVTDVAAGCGFGDLSEFTRRFGASFGERPTGYRAS